MTNKHDFEDRHFDVDVYDEDYFEGLGQKSGYKSYQNAQGIVRDQFSMINNVMSSRVINKKHLDIGCAYGHSVQKMTELNWDSSGLDISKFAIDRGRQIYGIHHPIGVFDARESSDRRGEEIGLVTAVEFFEHIGTEDVSKVLNNMAAMGDWGCFCINGRTSPGDSLDGSHGDHGHLNNHSMSWWITEISKYGGIDFEAMFELSKQSELYNREVHWHNRYVVVKFDRNENL